MGLRNTFFLICIGRLVLIVFGASQNKDRITTRKFHVAPPEMIENIAKVAALNMDPNSSGESHHEGNHQGELYQGVVGRPGIDFPVFSTLPQTTFSCRGQKDGYFADLGTQCQVFHLCDRGRKISFLCPNGTIFQQAKLTCDWWFNVACGPSAYNTESSNVLLKENTLFTHKMPVNHNRHYDISEYKPRKFEILNEDDDVASRKFSNVDNRDQEIQNFAESALILNMTKKGKGFSYGKGTQIQRNLGGRESTPRNIENRISHTDRHRSDNQSNRSSTQKYHEDLIKIITNYTFKPRNTNFSTSGGGNRSSDKSRLYKMNAAPASDTRSPTSKIPFVPSRQITTPRSVLFSHSTIPMHLEQTVKEHNHYPSHHYAHNLSQVADVPRFVNNMNENKTRLYLSNNLDITSTSKPFIRMTQRAKKHEDMSAIRSSNIATSFTKNASSHSKNGTVGPSSNVGPQLNPYGTRFANSTYLHRDRQANDSLPIPDVRKNQLQNTNKNGFHTSVRNNNPTPASPVKQDFIINLTERPSISPESRTIYANLEQADLKIDRPFENPALENMRTNTNSISKSSQNVPLPSARKTTRMPRLPGMKLQVESPQLLTNKTIDIYCQIFGTRLTSLQSNNQKYNSRKADIVDKTFPTESSRTSGKNETRKLAHVATNDLLPYLNNPEFLRNILFKIRPTGISKPRISESSNKYVPYAFDQNKEFTSQNIYPTSTSNSLKVSDHRKFDENPTHQNKQGHFSQTIPSTHSDYNAKWWDETDQTESTRITQPSSSLPFENSNDHEDFFLSAQSRSFVASRNSISRQNAAQISNPRTKYFTKTPFSSSYTYDSNFSLSDFINGTVWNPLMINDQLRMEPTSTMRNILSRTQKPTSRKTSVVKTNSNDESPVRTNQYTTTTSFAGIKISTPEANKRNTERSGVKPVSKQSRQISLKDIYTPLNQTSANHLLSAMEASKVKPEVRKSLLLLIQTFEDDNNKGNRKSKKELISSILKIGEKEIQSSATKSITKPTESSSFTLDNRLTSTSYSNPVNEKSRFKIHIPNPEDQQDKVSTDSSIRSNTEQSEKVQNRISTTKQKVAENYFKTSLDSSSTGADSRTLELLKSLYSLALQFRK